MIHTHFGSDSSVQLLRFIKHCFHFTLLEVHVHLEHHGCNMDFFFSSTTFWHYKYDVLFFGNCKWKSSPTLPTDEVYFFSWKYVPYELVFFWSAAFVTFVDWTSLSIFFSLLDRNLFFIQSLRYCIQGMLLDTPMRRMQGFVNNSIIEIFSSSLCKGLKRFDAEIFFLLLLFLLDSSFYNFLSWL